MKTGRLQNGAIIFNCYSTHRYRNGPFCRPYSNEIEFFGIYCRELNSAYLIPVNDLPRLAGSLRVHATRNRQVRRVRWAETYLIHPRPNG